MTRQTLRNGTRLVSLLLFPVILYYLSPYVIIRAASQGIINGSLIVFISMFLVSLFLGRFWCGWLCPGSGLNMACGQIKPTPAKGGKRTLLKYAIWTLWLGVIAFIAYQAGGYSQLDFFYLTTNGVSVTKPWNYLIYYTVVGIIVSMNLIWGKGAMCKYICWMAPFMAIGTKIKNAIRYPSLHLESDSQKCVSCKLCTRNCPMGLDVHEMVKNEDMLNSECINCASCIDICPKNAIKFGYLWK
jgi:ferredoxin-type protein NapH